MNARKIMLVLLILCFTVTPVYGYTYDPNARSLRGIWLTDLKLPDTIHAGEQVEVEFTYDYNFSYTVDLYTGDEYLSKVPVNLWLWGLDDSDALIDDYFNVTGEGTETYEAYFTAPEEGTYEVMARADYTSWGLGSDGWEYFFTSSSPPSNVTLTMTVLPAQSSGSTTTTGSTDTPESSSGGIPGFPVAAIAAAIPLALYKRKRR